MDGHGLQAQLERGLVARVAGDDDVVLIHDDRLTKAELANGGGHGRHGVIVAAGVVGEGWMVASGRISMCMGTPWKNEVRKGRTKKLRLSVEERSYGR